MVRGRGYREAEVVKLAELAAQGKVSEGAVSVADTLYFWDGYSVRLDRRRQALRREAFVGLFRGARTTREMKYVLYRFAKCEGIPEAWNGPSYLDGKDSDALTDFLSEH